MARRKTWDFSGWASKNDLRCADGLTIRKNAFISQDGTEVPLVYNHKHDSVDAILGHALLENREEGVYAYCYLNDTPSGRKAKEIISHGDVCSLSIWANNLAQKGRDVMHGVIREVSMVLAGANPGAFIESVVAHGVSIDEDEDEGIIYTGEPIELGSIVHSQFDDDYDDEEEDEGMTIEEAYDSMDDAQKAACRMIAEQAVVNALEDEDTDYDEEYDDEEYDDVEDDDDGDYDEGYDEDDEDDYDEEGEVMAHNIFESNDYDDDVVYLSHSDEEAVFERARALGSLKAAIQETVGDGVLAHSIDTTGMTLATGTQNYGFNDPEMLFPEYKAVNGEKPEWISRDMAWVSKVLGGVHHTPFSRIKSLYANITEDEARARGYMKGNLKKEEVFSLLKRTTSPQLIYKKQKLDRQDILQVTSFDIVAWIRAEMKVMLNEEIARAILIGDGRDASSEDKINPENIRPIATDKPLYNTVVKINLSDDMSSTEAAEYMIDAIIRSRKDYKGSGNPTFFTTEDAVTEMLLVKDKVGHRIYKTLPEVATAIRAGEIVTVEPMEGHMVEIEEGESKKSYPLLGIMVNLVDYNVGKDPGMEETNFQDFDIDYNQYKYLIETMMSGALIKPKSALTFVLDKTAPAGSAKWPPKDGAAGTRSSKTVSLD